MSARDNGRNKPFNPDRRCHWFDSNGRPYKRLDGGLGCPRKTNCYFAHPQDLDAWRSARPSGEPPLHYLTDDEYRLIVGRHRSPGRPVGHPSTHTHAGARHRSLSADRDRRRRERELPSGGARRRSSSRDREMTLAARLRTRRSSSRDRADGRPMGQRSSRSRSPLRGRLQHRSPPLPYGAPQTPAPRGPRAYGSVPDGPRNGGAQGTPRSPVVFPKVEAMDVPMKDMTSTRVPVVRESSIASSHIPSHQLTPSRAPNASTALTTAAIAATSAPGPSVAPNSDSINNLLESSTLQWQQISSAVAAATSAVPKSNGAYVAGDASEAEKHKIWTSRIELLAAATRIYNDCRAMENDIKEFKQLVESFSYQALPAEDRTVIEDHLHTLQSQLAQKTDELQRIVNQLTAAKFWPTHTHKQPPSYPQDNRERELANEISKLNESVMDARSMVKQVGQRWEQLSTQLQSNGGSTQANAFLAEAIIPSELEKIRDNLTAIGERVENVEGELVRPREIVLEQIEAIVAENVQSIILASTGSVEAKAPPPRAALSNEQLKMLQMLQQNAAATGQKVTRLSQEVTQMAARNDQLQTENMKLQGENAQLRQQLEELQAVQPGNSGDSKKIDRMQAEMRALNAAVMAYISHSPNAQPANPNIDAIVQQIAPQIVKSIPEVIAPEIQTMRNQIQEALRIQQQEASKELSLKMSLTLQAVEAVKHLVGGTHKSPRPANTMTSAVNGTQ